MALRKFVVPVLTLSLMATVTSAQMTPEQKRLYEEYLEEKARAPVSGGLGEIDRYVTPPVFSDRGSDLVDEPTLKDTVMVSPPSSTGDLKMFGYNMFDGSAESFSPIMEATPPPDYKLGPGDNVLVNVWGRVDMQLELTVDREGKVFIPKVGEIIAWGLTMQEFKKRLQTSLSTYYTDYDLSVSLGKIRRIKVFVYGEVKRPGGYTISSLSTLFSALYKAGGANENGSLRSIKHIRHNKLKDKIDLYRFLLTGDNTQDAELQSGDVIFVPVVGPKVSITGQVKRPAIYEIFGSERLTDLIELAGGSTAEAFLEMVDVDRIGDDDNRILLTVDLSDEKYDDDSNLVLFDGDRVHVPSMFGLQKNTVTLAGHVKHPGSCELTDSMRVSDLIDCGEQLIRDSYTRRANLFRTWPDLTREVYSVNIDAILEGIDSDDYPLMDKDSLVVYSQDDIKREMKVSISGAVKYPGTYEYFQGMRLTDVIFLAGNVLKRAYLLRAEIARVNPGKPADMIYANLQEAIENKDGLKDILLEEDDIVYIRSIPRYRIGQSVTIEGEIEFPGSYALTRENERLLDLFERCGGFTPDAFIEGMVFIRESILKDVEKHQIKTILASTEATVLDSINRPIPKLAGGLDLSRVNRIIIDTGKLFDNPDSPDNVALRHGDYIYIPQKPSGVQVLGAVASSGTISFEDDKKPRYFINEAGGYTTNANKGQVRLVKANGRIFSGKRAFKKEVDMGDIIAVPYKMKKETEWLRSAVSVAGIMASIATTVFVIDRL
jgi:protein involved in polysaccharide export with SLBB domain